ncbi:MAG: DUF362 domain-containing protein [Candidatus Aminicenantes bacterium]|nr:DUF362 domain-containing protein [Candidatus Aminicenantes bacterium]
MSEQVFFIPAHQEEGSQILSQKTEKIFRRLDFTENIDHDSFVALKIHFGEKGNKGYIKPSWLSDTMKVLKERSGRIFFTDTNTLYVGNRSNASDHVLLAHGHGFDERKWGVPVIIADGLIGRNSDDIVIDKPRIHTAKIASLFSDSDVLVCLSHFTGHMLTGFGAAIKNLGMGCASRSGKLDQHSDVHPRVNPKYCDLCQTCFDYCPEEAISEKQGTAFIDSEQCIGCGECLVVCPRGAVKMTWDDDKIRVQEKMAEYAFAVNKVYEGKIVCINFLIHITKDCDCMCKGVPPFMEDIGILASKDPVALDQASADLIDEQSGKDILRIKNDVDWTVQLKHAEDIGLGNRNYRLVKCEL